MWRAPNRAAASAGMTGVTTGVMAAGTTGAATIIPVAAMAMATGTGTAGATGATDARAGTHRHCRLRDRRAPGRAPESVR